ncbi:MULTISPECIES: hypothetical protein [Halomonadaceae]|jgi:hypothetical protein|uniref:Uncharacterized protein n=1 Tax=Onishia taeanensis TaxID=284577 RepID=A0A328XE42_9GAMM|nr:MULTISPECIES: hypothetical protein [Halomonas]MDI4638321.1 hypothetical protein [Halomonas sp. BMC7]RAR57080.1 hypothetical protein BCL93_11613 [Halomonas taeanensis]|tara:strand:- start:2100 stop:2246 length:147 start_codon:yes stop_codon:yes gene_type:complete
MMLSNECFALMGLMGWLMPLAFMLFLGLGTAAYAKYVITFRHSQENRS